MSAIVSSPSETACLLPMNKEEYIAYLKGRKSSHKVNYHLEGQKQIRKIQESGEGKPRLLLHVCCAVCACYPLEYLNDIFDLTVYYNNSNIWPQAEHDLRLSELKRYIHEAFNDSIQVIVPPYNNAEYTKNLEPMKDDPEGWQRCFYCYEVRLREAYAYAQEHGFDYFTTVMTSSRQKDSQKINEIGLKLETQYPGTVWLKSDFKKGGGQVRAKELIEQYQIYCQTYCGCVFSYRPEEKCHSS